MELEKTLRKDLSDWGVCRHTVTTDKGIYVFNAYQDVDSFRVELLHFQHRPAEEKTLVKHKSVPQATLAVDVLMSWYREERWLGYDLKQKPFTVQMWLEQQRR